MAASEADKQPGTINFSVLQTYTDSQLLECFTTWKNVPSHSSHQVTKEYSCRFFPDVSVCRFKVVGEYAKRRMRSHLKKHMLSLKKWGAFTGNSTV